MQSAMFTLSRYLEEKSRGSKSDIYTSVEKLHVTHTLNGQGRFNASRPQKPVQFSVYPNEAYTILTAMDMDNTINFI